MPSRRRTNRTRRTRQRGGKYSDSSVPYDPQYHEDLSKADMKKHISQIEEDIARNDVLLKTAQERTNIDKQHQNKKLENDELIAQQNKPQTDLLSEQVFQHRFNSLFSFVRYIFDIISWVLKQIVEKGWTFLGGTANAFVKIITVETIISIIAYIITIYFIGSLIFGYAVSMPAGLTGLTGSTGQTSMSTTSLSSSNNMYKYADEKLKYIQSQDPITQIKTFITNIPSQFSVFLVNIKNMFRKLRRISASPEDDDLQMFSKARTIDNSGRWDNVYNLELGKLVNNIENVNDNNHIYTILKPKPIELYLSAVANKDLERLPPYIQSNIKSGKDKVVFNWNLDRQAEATGLIKYKMPCNPVDATGTEVHLFNDTKDANKCTINEIQYVSEKDTASSKPKYYDEPTRRYGKEAYDAFV